MGANVFKNKSVLLLAAVKGLNNRGSVGYVTRRGSPSRTRTRLTAASISAKRIYDFSDLGQPTLKQHEDHWTLMLATSAGAHN